MPHVDATEDATSRVVLRGEPSEFSARFENGVVTHFEVKSGRLPVSTASAPARHVKGDAVASGTRRDTQTQPSVARIFQVRGKAQLPR